MKEGKVPTDILSKLIYTNLGVKRNEVAVHAGIGEDCSVIEFGQYAAVLSTDPITASNNLSGYLSVIISCNDIASCGAKPIGVLETILLPIGSDEESLNKIVQEIDRGAKELNIEVLGGHSEVTSSVNKPVISTTAIGVCSKDKFIKTSGAKLNDDVIVTKSVGIEGTFIVVNDYYEKLSNHISESVLDSAKSFITDLSVVKEGLIAAECGVNCMHDITEGGILGAAFEIAEASNMGIEIFSDLIPVRNETKIICDYFNLDPFKLISSGSMIITSSNGKKIVDELKKQNIDATIVGKITKSGKYLIDGNKKIEINPPTSDEIYNIL
ncbi:AIR synthase family protein [Thermoanaerobacterium thermosulfurigenes]|uniref:AIR synthase family protein n=1 Tax=Thermoanaerobacterium thermosulfurigenes TaxID=33950 RepID=UPI003EF74815